MSQRFPCPNPMCTHAFAEGDLANVASVTCPKCGMMTQIRAAAPVRPIPMARPVAATPMNRPVQPAAVPAVPPDVEPAVADEPAEPTAPIVRPKATPRLTGLAVPLAAIGFVVFVVLVGGGILGLYLNRRGGIGSIFGNSGGMTSSQYNFKFDPSNDRWAKSIKLSDDLKSKNWNALLVMERSEPAGYFVLDVIKSDYQPTMRQLDREARDRLKAVFTKNLETEPAPDAAPVPGDPIAKQATQRIVFEGSSEADAEQVMRGEVSYFADQGIGYLLYAWSPKSNFDALAEDFKSLRESFSLLGEREEWKSRHQQQGRLFEGNGYRVSAGSKDWVQQPDPKDHDPEADMVLRAPDPAAPKNKTLAVDLLIMKLPSADDPVAAARKHILTMYERDAFSGTKIGDAGEGEAPKDMVGQNKGHLLRWRIDNGGGRVRFAMVGVVPSAGNLIVLYADCQWNRRNTWEESLRQVIESVQLKD